MELYLNGNGFRYELENLCRLFFPFERISVHDAPVRPDGDFFAVAAVEKGTDGVLLSVRLRRGDFDRSDRCAAEGDGQDDESERRLAVMLFELLCQNTGMRPQWGILTGVRPGKLMRRMIAERGEEGARSYFSQQLLCSQKKIDLCRTAAENEDKILAQSRPDHFSLYLSIPFCPTRCSYCSFVSHSVEKSMKLVDEYVRLLCVELEHTGRIARRLGLTLSTVYIGGGTPTALSAQQLQTVMAAVAANFDLASASEYTVEAGRPDTVTVEKLDAILAAGATRISINPQTLNDRVLETIGRRHTAQQTLDAFALARSRGFSNINMDLIAGLPGDTEESFHATLDGVLGLSPESVTVHTLSLKRSSRMTVGGEYPEAEAGALADRMLTDANRRLCGAGYRPYYLYRQSKTVGNLENTGYAKPGFESRYNIFIMDETHSILACGASAVTKLRSADGYIERIFNFKYPYEYISRFDEMLRRKDAVEAFYGRYPI